jgi:hypothetical protein
MRETFHLVPGRGSLARTHFCHRATRWALVNATWSLDREMSVWQEPVEARAWRRPAVRLLG